MKCTWQITSGSKTCGKDAGQYAFCPEHANEASRIYPQLPLSQPALPKDTRVMVVVIDENAPGTIMNVRAGEQFGGVIYTVSLDDRTLTPDGLYYARPFEISTNFRSPEAK